MEYTNSVVPRITRALEEKDYKYTVRDNGYYEIVLEDRPDATFLIACRHTELMKIVRLHWFIPIDPETVALRKGRLLEACDVTNRQQYLKARLFHDGVDITYAIPESAWDIAEQVVLDVMYFFYTKINAEIFRKAIESDEDLYQSFDVVY